MIAPDHYIAEAIDKRTGRVVADKYFRARIDPGQTAVNALADILNPKRHMVRYRPVTVRELGMVELPGVAA